MKKTVLAIVLAAPVALCLAIAAWPQGLGLEQAPIVAQVVAARVGVIGIALVLTLLALLLSLWRAARRFALLLVALLLAFSLVSGGIHLSRASADAVVTEAAGDVTVLTWNTLGDAPGVDELVALIQETDADIVALPETTGVFATDAAVQLREAGRPFWVHYTRFSPDYRALSTALMISADLGTYTTDSEAGQTRTLPTIVARPDDGSGPVIVATHPVAPVPQQMRNWRSDLDYLAELCTIEESVLMAGDFNSTIDHWASLGVNGGDLGACRDAAIAAGAGTAGTWPTDLPAWAGAQIDHVVATADWQVVDARVITDRDGAGSDHRPVVAVLRQVG